MPPSRGNRERRRDRRRGLAGPADSNGVCGQERNRRPTAAQRRNRPRAARRRQIGARPGGERSPSSSHFGRGTSRLLDWAAEAIEDAAFGLHLAQRADPRDAGIFIYVASAAENLSEALALLARYSRIANEAARVKLTATPDGLVVEIGFVGLPRPLGRQGAEFLMAA